MGSAGRNGDLVMVSLVGLSISGDTPSNQAGTVVEGTPWVRVVGGGSSLLSLCVGTFSYMMTLCEVTNLCLLGIQTL